jgi:hypothetical protein
VVPDPSMKERGLQHVVARWRVKISYFSDLLAM